MLRLSKKGKRHIISGKVGKFCTFEFEIPQVGTHNQASQKETNATGLC